MYIGRYKYMYIYIYIIQQIYVLDLSPIRAIHF